MENVPLIEAEPVTSSGDVVKVEIQKRDSISSNTLEESPSGDTVGDSLAKPAELNVSISSTKTECYVGHVTHYRPKAVKFIFPYV